MTKQQLGYIVGVTTVSLEEVRKECTRFIFQGASKQFSPVHCEKALGNFLAGTKRCVQELPRRGSEGES